MAKVYVGTYGKYNNGSIDGAWLDLADYETYDDFLAACRKVHKDEHDPEFMIQDSDGFPDGLDCMEWLGQTAFNDVKLAMKEEEQEAAGRPAINIIEYSERSFAVVGDTKAVKDALKKMGGSFNRRLSCGAGWIFSNKKREEVERFINSDEVTERVNAERKTPKEGQKFVDWLNEYLARSHDEYIRKNAVGAIKMHDRYYIIDKPSIENRFCFHDEGPDYDLYKELSANDTKMGVYFKNHNLRAFDGKIDHMTNGEGYDSDKRVWWYPSKSDGNRLYLCFYDRGSEPENVLCTDEERSLILKGLQVGRSMFESRLDNYLKRYGVSKLHTWTYWADA